MMHGYSARTLGTLTLASTLLAGAGTAWAGDATVRFDPPKRNGSVRIFITDMTGTTLSATANITANMTAAQKRAAIQTAITTAGLPAGWTVNGAGNGLTITNANNRSIVANFYPRNTGELQDRAVINGASPSTFPGGHGNMDPHAPNGMSTSNGTGPARFNAGVIVGGTEYVYSIMGNDPIFGGASTVPDSLLTSLLYNGLSGMSLPSGVTLSNTGHGIDVDFSPSATSLGDYGLVWGTDSLTGGPDDSGFNGTLSSVPAPGSLALLGAGAACCARRRRPARVT